MSTCQLEEALSSAGLATSIIFMYGMKARLTDLPFIDNVLMDNNLRLPPIVHLDIGLYVSHIWICSGKHSRCSSRPCTTDNHRSRSCGDLRNVFRPFHRSSAGSVRYLWIRVLARSGIQPLLQGVPSLSTRTQSPIRQPDNGTKNRAWYPLQSGAKSVQRPGRRRYAVHRECSASCGAEPDAARKSSRLYQSHSGDGTCALHRILQLPGDYIGADQAGIHQTHGACTGHCQQNFKSQPMMTMLWNQIMTSDSEEEQDSDNVVCESNDSQSHSECPTKQNSERTERKC